MNSETPSPRQNLKMALLAGTCLAASASIAPAATTYNETTDFTSTLSDALLSPLPFGTDEVTASLTSSPVDSSDLMVFTGLLPGGLFTLAFSNVPLNVAYFTFDVWDSSGAHVGTPGFVNGDSSATFEGTIPLDGKLVAQVGLSEGNGPYTVNLTAATVPEPSAAALAGLGVAAAAMRRSRHPKKTS